MTYSNGIDFICGIDDRETTDTLIVVLLLGDELKIREVESKYAYI